MDVSSDVLLGSNKAFYIEQRNKQFKRLDKVGINALPYIKLGFFRRLWDLKAVLID